MAVVGFTAWIVGGAIVRSSPLPGTLEDVARSFLALPRDGIVWIVQHTDELEAAAGEFRLRDNCAGADSYFWAPELERIVFNSDDEATNRARYGDSITLSRGKWVHRDEYELARIQAQDERVPL